MMQIIYIGLGGAIGALLRYGTTVGAQQFFGTKFPYGTLIANVLGCGVIGILYALMLERWAVSAYWRDFLMIGLLGGFTTFSAFSLDSFRLLMAGHQWLGLFNIGSTMILCLMATWLGLIIGSR